MANYNLTNQSISSSFQQLLQKNEDTGKLVDGTGSVVQDLEITGSVTASYFVGDGSLLTNVSASVVLPNGVVSGSSQIDLSLASGVAVSSSYAITSSHALNGGVTSIIAGNNITIDQSQGNVTINSTTTASADWNNLTNIPSGLVSSSEQLPAGLVSGSSQIILTDTTGDIGGNRITGSVSNAISSSYAVTASYALNVETIDTGSLLVTASFDNGTRDLTFTKGDSSQFSVNIPDVSGSDLPAGLVSGSSQIILEDTTFTDGSNDMFLSTDGAGNLSFDWVKTLHQNIHNAEATPILRGTPLFVSGATGDNANVYIADAANPLRRPATLIAFDETLAASATGTGIISGEIQGVDTNLYPAGTVVYLGVGGGWSSTRPTGSASVQALGVITRSSNNGRGVVFNQIGNNLPNIAQDKVWVGDSNGVPQEVSINNLGLALTGSNNTFSGTQTFNDIVVNGTGSFAYIQSVTGSAKIIGDAYIILNNDTPTERYAGIKVQDSGSTNTTASLEFDGVNNDWFYEYTDDGGVTTDHGVVLFGPEYDTKGTPSYPLTNVIQKGTGTHHLTGSNITDDGSLVVITSNTENTGSFGVQGQLKTTANGTTSTGTILTENVGSGGRTGLTFSQPAFNSSFQIAQNPNTGGGQVALQKAGVGQVVFNLDGTSGLATVSVANGIVNNNSYLGSDYIQAQNASGSIDRRLILGVASINHPSPDLTGHVPYIAIRTNTGFQEVMTFQDPSTYTDGTVTFKTPISSSQGVSVQELAVPGKAFLGEFTGSLQSGYMWVGNGGDESEQIPTSSFDDRYAVKLGDNSFTGSNTFSGSNFTISAGTTASIEEQPFVPVFTARELIGFNKSYGTIGNYPISDLSTAGIFLEGNNTDIVRAAGITTKFESSGSALTSYRSHSPIAMEDKISSSGTGYLTFVRQQYEGDGSTTLTMGSNGKILIGTGGGGIPTSQFSLGNPTMTTPVQVWGSGGLYVNGGPSGTNGVFLTSSSLDIVNASTTFSGSIKSEVSTISVVSDTASVDFSSTSMFELTLVSGSDTHIDGTNVGSGQTLNLLIKQPSVGTGSVSFSPSFLQPTGSEYIPTAVSDSEDILTLVTFSDTSKIYVANVKQLV